MRTNRYRQSLVALIVTALLVLVSCEKEDATTITKITLNENVISLVLGNSQTLTATIDPPAAASDIVWSSSDQSVATVIDGKVTTVGLGKAVINAKIANSTAFCDVFVTKENIPVTGIFLNKNAMEMKVGDEQKLILTLTPEEATNRKRRWSSSNENVVSVHEIDGTITARALGEAVITVKTLDGELTATCNVAVLPGIQLQAPSTDRIHLRPSDFDKNVSFAWTKIEGLGVYKFKISTSDKFEDENLVYSASPTTNNYTISILELNNLMKELPDDITSLYWTVESGDINVRLLSSTSVLNVAPSLEILQVDNFNNHVEVMEKSDNYVKFKVLEDKSDPLGNLTKFTRKLPTKAVLFCFEYKSDKDLKNNLEFFMAPIDYSNVKNYRAGVVPMNNTGQWKEHVVNISELRLKDPEWGKIGDFLRVDFGEAPSAGMTMEIRNIHIRYQ